MTMCTITHAYLTVGLAGMTAFFLLGVCGQHHDPAMGELGGTEVLMSDAMRPEPRSLHGLPRLTAPVEKDRSVRPVGGWGVSVREISATQ